MYTKTSSCVSVQYGAENTDLSNVSAIIWNIFRCGEFFTEYKGNNFFTLCSVISVMYVWL